MSLLDDVSIVVTPNAYTAGRLYGVLPTATEGSELITCGDFACADPNAAWSRGTGWAISGGTANSDGSQTSNSNLLQDTGASTVGKTFKISYKVSNYSAGAAFIGMGGYNYAAKDIEQNGEFTQYLLVANSSSNTNFYITANSDFVGSIDNISVKEFTGSDMDVTRATAATRVDENGLVNYAEILGSERVTNGDFATTSNWSENGGANAWSISGGKANCVAFASLRYFEQTNALETSGAGKTYKVVFTVSNYIQGVLRINVGGYQVGAAVTSNGTHTQYIAVTNASSNKSVYLQSNANTILSVDNISVKEEARNNVPRIDYTGGGCPHILAEPQRTNEIVQSENFSDGSYVKTNATVLSGFVSPSGDTTAYKMTATAANGQLRFGEVFSNTDVKAVSVFAKANTSTSKLTIVEQNYLGTQATFDLNLGVIDSSSTTSSKMENYGNGWYRCIITQAYSSGQTAAVFAFRSATVDSLFLWGSQAETGSFASSYIPTSGSAVTRNQDIFTRDGIASLINSTEGVLFTEIAALFEDGSNRSISLSDGTTSNRVVVRYIGSNVINAFCVVGGSAQASLSHAVSNITNFSKAAFKYKANDFALWIDGVEVATDTSGTLPSADTFNSLKISGAAGANNFFGKVKQLQVYKTALTDAQLTSLTS